MKSSKREGVPLSQRDVPIRQGLQEQLRADMSGVEVTFRDGAMSEVINPEFTLELQDESKEPKPTEASFDSVAIDPHALDLDAREIDKRQNASDYERIKIELIRAQGDKRLLDAEMYRELMKIMDRDPEISRKEALAIYKTEKSERDRVRAESARSEIKANADALRQESQPRGLMGRIRSLFGRK